MFKHCGNLHANGFILSNPTVLRLARPTPDRGKVQSYVQAFELRLQMSGTDREGRPIQAPIPPIQSRLPSLGLAAAPPPPRELQSNEPTCATASTRPVRQHRLNGCAFSLRVVDKRNLALPSESPSLQVRILTPTQNFTCARDRALAHPEKRHPKIGAVRNLPEHGPH